MKKGTMNREEAIKRVGLEAVEAVEAMNCDYTNRLMDNGLVEFSASIEAEDDDGPCTLVAYYYQEQEDLDSMDDDEGLDSMTWEIQGYDIF